MADKAANAEPTIKEDHECMDIGLSRLTIHVVNPCTAVAGMFGPDGVGVRPRWPIYTCGVAKLIATRILLIASSSRRNPHDAIGNACSVSPL